MNMRGRSCARGLSDTNGPSPPRPLPISFALAACSFYVS